MRRDNLGFSARLIVGLAVIAAGILFTLDNLDLIDSWEYVRFWPAILIFIGVAHFVQGRGRVGSAIFILVGTWLLLDTLDLVELDISDLFPLILVIVGAHLVWRSMRGPAERASGGRSMTSATSADTTVNAFAMMAGIERKNTSNEFRGGELTAIMGGCQLDLRQSKLATRGDVIVDVFAFWGGIDIKVPTTWGVVGQVTPLMGAFEDKTVAPQQTEGRIIIRGMAIMGGIEVSN